jgi:type IV pilus assembly protein PilB
MIRERLGQLLLEAVFVTPPQLEEALGVQRQRGGRLGTVLVELQLLTEEDLLQVLSQQYGVPALPEFDSSVDSTLTQTIPTHFAVSRGVVPVYRVGSRLTVAMVDPSDVSLLDELAFQSGYQVVPVVASWGSIQQRIGLLYGADIFSNGSRSGNALLVSPDSHESSEKAHNDLSSGSFSLLSPGEFESLCKEATSSLPVSHSSSSPDAHVSDSAPIVELVDRIISPAIQDGVSDIHLEPFERSVRVRFRLDGVLYSVMTYPLSLRNAMVSRLKILAHLNIAERRIPQDGRFSYHHPQKGPLDIRVSILPCFHGEKVVLRLLDRSGFALPLSSLGFEAPDLTTLMQAMEKPDGMILVTGPTGSGKTTTLYSALNLLNTPGVNIVTVEDPVEYQLTGVNQVHVREEIGLGFADVLRAVLRQDPDILMVGEIRDSSTAQIAVKAALTGHRVLSTVHTNDAVKTVTRLLDMGVEPYLVASSLSVILAQRLVRKICGHCQDSDPHPLEQLITFGFSPDEVPQIMPMKGRGCGHCHFTGYEGRVAIGEVLPMTEPLQQLILRRASPEELFQAGTLSGFTSLRQNGLKKVKAGLTTLSEIMKSTTGIPKSSSFMGVLP